MKTAIRYIAFALTVLMLLGSFVACAETGTGDGETTPQEAATNPTPGQTGEETDNLYDANGFLKSDLPDELDFGGETFTVLWWNDVERPEFYVEDTNGELVNDAIFERNAKVESQMGITFEWVDIKGQYNSDGKNYSNHVGNVYESGDTIYDLMSAHSRTIALTAMNGYCANLMELDYLNFSMPWWPKIMTETATIGDKMYFVTGDVSTNSIHMMYTIFYNKDLITDRPGLIEPAQSVLEDNWTIETFQLLTKDMYQDLDGSNSANEGDIYGFTSLNWHFDAIYYGAGLKQAEKDEENLIKISPDYFSDKAIALCDDIQAWIKDGGVYINSTYYDDVFLAGRSIMSMSRHKDIAEKLVEGDFKFGIAPIPKYDNNQEKHITCVGNPVSFYAIYARSADLNRAAAVLECWASEAYRLTSPALFETTFKLRYSETTTESQMYDIIREGITFDIGRLFNSSLGNMSDQWDDCAVSGTTSWSRKSSALQKTLGKQLLVITNKFKALQ
jgi:hypothetical protein